jgi:signal transduction histidine kinase
VGVIRDVSFQKENERLRDDFIATLTHDLRTPLLAAISGLDFALTRTLGDLNPKQDELFSTMKKSNEDMLGLVNALLEVYRYESGKLYLCRTKFCVSELISQSIKELLPLIEEENIALNFTGDELVINADKNELRRVIVNLIGNAVKHCGSGAKLEVSASAQNRDLTVSVQDDGPGLSDEDIDKLFKRFSQGTSQKRPSSVGLGLYLSRQIIEAHGGKIWAESDLDRGQKGSKFSFTLKDAVMIAQGRV